MCFRVVCSATPRTPPETKSTFGNCIGLTSECESAGPTGHENERLCASHSSLRHLVIEAGLQSKSVPSEAQAQSLLCLKGVTPSCPARTRRKTPQVTTNITKANSSRQRARSRIITIARSRQSSESGSLLDSLRPLKGPNGFPSRSPNKLTHDHPFTASS
jgi:hypothetical protein